MKKILFVFFFSALCLSSCKGFLDTVPEDGIGSLEMWTTKEHADLGIVGAYSPIKSFPIGSDPYSPAGCISSNPMTDTYTKYAFAWGTGFDDTGCRYFCNNSATTSYGVFSNKWLADYTGVQYCNLAIENIVKMEDLLEEETFNNYVGEAHFLRALYYFDLLTFYSGHKNNDPGVPLYTSMPDYDKSYRARSTPADVRKVMIVLQLYLPIGAVLAFFLIQKAIKERHGELTKAVEILKQGWTPEEHFSPWMIILFIALGTGILVWGAFIANRQRLLRTEEKQFKQTRQLDLSQNIRLLRETKDLRNELAWDDFTAFCAQSDKRLNAITTKLQAFGLNEQDVRICVLVLIGLSHKETAEILNCSPKSIGKLKDLTAKKLGVSGGQLQEKLLKTAIL